MFSPGIQGVLHHLLPGIEFGCGLATGIQLIDRILADAAAEGSPPELGDPHHRRGAVRMPPAQARMVGRR